MDATVADEKIHAVVNLVLQAVDQRLGPVREQLAELTNAMHRSHAEFGNRIDECQRLVAALQLTAGPPDRSGADAPTAQATARLIDATTVLTDQVAFLEARVNSYTNSRIAEVKMLIDRAGWAPTSEPTSSKSTLMASTTLRAADDLDNVAPAVARLSPLSRAGNVTVTAPVIATPAVPTPTAMAAPAPTPSPVPSLTRTPVPALTQPPASAPASAAAAAFDPEPAFQMSDDIARLSAQMSARLAAAVDRALGVVPVT